MEAVTVSRVSNNSRMPGMAHVKGLLPALLILPMSFGCLGAQIRSAAETPRRLQTIVVVPMEAPPLEYVASEASDFFVLESLTSGRMIRLGRKQAEIVAAGISMVITLIDIKDFVDALRERPAIAESMENIWTMKKRGSPRSLSPGRSLDGLRSKEKPS